MRSGTGGERGGVWETEGCPRALKRRRASRRAGAGGREHSWAGVGVQPGPRPLLRPPPARDPRTVCGRAVRRFGPLERDWGQAEPRGKGQGAAAGLRMKSAGKAWEAGGI